MKMSERVGILVFLIISLSIIGFGWMSNRQAAAHANEIAPSPKPPMADALPTPISGVSYHATKQTQPAKARAYFNRGTAYYRRGDFKSAIRVLSKALALEPAFSDTYFNRGLSYRRLHKNEEAISDFSKAIQLEAGRASYYFERCNARIVTNRLDGAVADCSETIRLSPSQPEPYLLRGVASRFNGDLEGALVDSLRALQIAPDYLDARRLLREVLIEREKVD